MDNFIYSLLSGMESVVKIIYVCCTHTHIMKCTDVRIGISFETAVRLSVKNKVTLFIVARIKSQ